MPEPAVDINEALSNRSQPTRVAVPNDAFLGFGIHFYVTDQGHVIVRFDMPPAHEVHKYAEYMGNFLFKLTNSHLNELIYNSHYEVLGDGEYVNKVMKTWHDMIDDSHAAPSGPIVKASQVLGS